MSSLDWRPVSDQRIIAAAHKHLGRPWSAHGFDCWECVRAIYSDAFGIILPICQFADDGRNPASYRDAIAEHCASSIWVPIDRPDDGCVVAMGKREWPHHVGVYLLDGSGRIAHCLENIGCCVDSVAMLRQSGWGFMRFYRFAGSP
jgi:cell wall-associated NlpC family hydrolase